jgi:multiple sugar transport system permease protein
MSDNPMQKGRVPKGHFSHRVNGDFTMLWKSGTRKVGTSAGRYLYTFVGLVIVAVMLFPVYWMVVNSLETNQDIFRSSVSLIPEHLTFQAYSDVFAAQLPHLLTSLLIALGTIVVALVIAVPAAYALAHFRFRLTLLIVFCLLLAQMLPAVTLATPMFLIFSSFGLLNSYWGLILADTTYAVPFCVVILRAYQQSLPYELVEAAFVDGTNEWGAFFRIMLPLSLPGIVTAGLFTFLFAWGDFLYGLTLTTTNTIEPISLSIYDYLGALHSQWNDMMAVATLAAIPAAILLIIFQRYITAGLTAGAVKG